MEKVTMSGVPYSYFHQGALADLDQNWLKINASVAFPQESTPAAEKYTQQVQSCVAMSPAEIGKKKADIQNEWACLQADIASLVQRWAEIRGSEMVLSTVEKLRKASQFEGGDNVWHWERTKFLQPAVPVAQMLVISNRAYGAELLLQEDGANGDLRYIFSYCTYVNADVKQRWFITDYYESHVINGPDAEEKAMRMLNDQRECLTKSFFADRNPVIPPYHRHLFLIDGQEIPGYRY